MTEDLLVPRPLCASSTRILHTDSPLKWLRVSVYMAPCRTETPSRQGLRVLVIAEFLVPQQQLPLALVTVPAGGGWGERRGFDLSTEACKGAASQTECGGPLGPGQPL